MKFKTLIIVVTSFFCALILGNALFFLINDEPPQDTVKINDVLQNCIDNWGNLDALSENEEIDFSILDNEGNLLFKSQKALSDSINSAIKNRDSILDIEVNDKVVGKLIIANSYQSAFSVKNSQFLAYNVVMLILLLTVLVGYITYVNVRIIRPFNALNKFATAISKGDLENELNMDRHNIFGAFTESFDIMRMEIKKARDAEQKAKESKKQLIANLSHDIKTPIASIKAIAELGECKAEQNNSHAFSTIVKKADQVNVLVSNLFSATLEELNQLSINVCDHESGDLLDMLTTADYLGKAEIARIPEMLLSFDRGRLQQVFDNIISNSYKYASTKIEINAIEKAGFLSVLIKDFGGLDEDSAKLTNKFYRAKNAEGKEGAGLGLFISEYLMTAMKGDIKIDCGKDYFLAEINIKIS